MIFNHDKTLYKNLFQISDFETQNAYLQFKHSVDKIAERITDE